MKFCEKKCSVRKRWRNYPIWRYSTKPLWRWYKLYQNNSLETWMWPCILLFILVHSLNDKIWNVTQFLAFVLVFSSMTCGKTTRRRWLFTCKNNNYKKTSPVGCRWTLSTVKEMTRRWPLSTGPMNVVFCRLYPFSPNYHGSVWVLPVISLLVTNTVSPVRACLIHWSNP
jgi:hypothetical protein